MQSYKTCLKLDTKIVLPPKYSKIRQKLCYKTKKKIKKLKKVLLIALHLVNFLNIAGFEYINNLPLP